MARTVAGHAQWYGSFTEGTGTLSTQTSDTITGTPYTFASRFDVSGHVIPPA